MASQAPASSRDISAAKKKISTEYLTTKRKINVSPRTTAQSRNAQPLSLGVTTLDIMKQELRNIRYEAGASLSGSDNPIVESVDKLPPLLVRITDPSGRQLVKRRKRMLPTPL